MINGAASLRTLREDPDVDVRPFPESVLRELKRHTDDVVAEITARNADAKAIYESLKAYQARSTPWQQISEGATLATRAL